jgi:hypothetical protein
MFVVSNIFHRARALAGPAGTTQHVPWDTGQAKLVWKAACRSHQTISSSLVAVKIGEFNSSVLLQAKHGW